MFVCGLCRIWESGEYRMYEVVGNAVASLPGVLRKILVFLGTWPFYLTLYVILS